MRESEIVADLLGTELLLKAEEEAGISPDFLLHLYHKSGRNREKFREAVEDALSPDTSTGKAIELVNTNLELIEREKKLYQQLRKGIVQDYISQLEEIEEELDSIRTSEW